ncbi:TraR/DksA C4-type zinc finger protein [Stutzerimonas stutzeri]|uniref:TraR/DksA family transcriptional regulator n=1 Tax=Stutzerimonas stutzeri TaxID=316 RepID=A0A172WR77_STUST|nr:TraR/DksA C4-type zinc finger protein [Stutzerimonas stutzeri]ANF26011.1 TraR/DksA family transcriptional regulator [Stutzerimonas stutzeri]
MTDYMEMTEAFEQARTAPDVTDRATGLEEADRIGGVALVQARLQGQGAEFCADCDEPIPDARRLAAPWAVCCVECQSLREGLRHG